MLRSSHDACGCSTQTTSTINLKRSTLHPHEGQADRPNTPSDSVNLGSNPGPPATHLPDMARSGAGNGQLSHAEWLSSREARRVETAFEKCFERITPILRKAARRKCSKASAPILDITRKYAVHASLKSVDACPA